MNEPILIKHYDEWEYGDVLIWYKGIDHPTVGKRLDGKWYFSTNGYDQLLFCPTFSPSFVVEPEKKPTHFWILPNTSNI